MKCPNCSFENPPEMNFCGKCGTPLVRECPKCSHKNPPDFKICEKCGERLDIDIELPSYANRSPRDYTPPFLAEKVLKIRSSLEGERKLVSVLFADVAGFTSIAEKLDPEDVHEIMDGCFEILGQEIHSAGGTINQYTGDGVMALFGAPVAHEDHIRRACYAALQVQKRLKDYASDLEKAYGINFEMRIGIHTGPVVVGAIGDNLRLDYTAVGDTTNLAARLQSLAKPGSILVSERVWKGAKQEFIFKEAGQLEVKGKKVPVQAYILIDQLESSSYEEGLFKATPLIDRKQELKLLKQCFREAVKQGPIIVSITGEAGIGKSKILHTFKQSLKSETVRIFRGHCRPYGSAIAFHPLATMFRNYFNLSNRDNLEKLRKQIIDQLDDKSFYPKLVELLELIEDIRSQTKGSEIVVQGKKRILFRKVKDILLTVCKKTPIILSLDDMQWVDASTREFLAFLLQTTKSAPMLIVCTGRPSSEHWCPVKPHYEIKVKPLSEKDSSTLLSKVLGTNRLDPAIKDKIIANAGGNTLFLVEVAETLNRQGLVVCDEKKCTLRLPVEEVNIPDTIHGVLAARLDSLPEHLKWTVQLASIIGTVFSREVLRALIGKAEDLDQALVELEQEGIIERLSPKKGRRYKFRHLMMREVAYQGLLRKDRKRYHRIVAETLERLYQDNLQLYFAHLSYHYYHAEEWEKAFLYTMEAGQQARKSYACHEALTCFNRALEVLERGSFPEKESKAVQIYEWQGRLHFCLGQMQEALSSFKSMLSRASDIGDKEAQAEALFRLGWAYFYTHHPRSAQKYLKKAMEISYAENIKETLRKASSFLGYVYAVLGKLKQAKPILLESAAVGKTIGDPEGRAWATAYLLQYYNWIGDFNKALILSLELEELNEEIKSPFFNILLHFRQGLIFGALGLIDEAKEKLLSGLEQLDIGDDKFWRPRFLNTLGWVHAEADEVDKALELNKKALVEALSVGQDPETVQNAQINVGENYLKMQDFTSAQEILEKSWEEVKKPGLFYTHWRYKTRLLINLADLYGKTGQQEKATYFLRKSLELIKKTEAKRHYARALLVKGRLLKDTSRSRARAALEEALSLTKEMGTKILQRRIEQELATLD